MPRPSQTPVLDLGRSAARQGVSTTRFRISREQAEGLRRIEREQGQAAGLQHVLGLIRAGRPAPK